MKYQSPRVYLRVRFLVSVDAQDTPAVNLILRGLTLAIGYAVQIKVKHHLGYPSILV